MGELTPEAGSLHDAPVSGEAPPSAAEKGAVGAFTIRQFFSVMKLCSQRKKRLAGWMDDGPTIGSEGGERGGGGSTEAIDVILLEDAAFVADWFKERRRGIGTGAGRF